jgi:hypothetical protein
MAKYTQSKLMKLSINEKIRALRKLNLATVNETYLENQVRELLNIGYVARPLIVNAPKAYRVRINENKKLFENAQDLWYPPPKCIKAKGRVNDIGESIFYYSDSEDTAIIEKRPNPGEYLTVLEAELIDPNNHPLIMVLGIHEFTARSNPNYGGTPPELDVKQKRFLKKEGISQTNPILQAYLAKEFMRQVTLGNEHEYKITITIAKILMNEPELLNEDGSTAVGITVDGFAYPSIASNNLGANVALKTESADRLYRPVACTLYCVEGKQDDTHYTIGKLMWSTSIEEDGTINWEER